MLYVTVIEDRDEKIAHAIAEYLSIQENENQSGILISDCSDFRKISSISQDIIVLSRTGAKKAAEAKQQISCGIMLMPGGEAITNVEADSVVTYGMSGRDTITLSSIEEQECVLALQRELMAVDGNILERQEIPVRRPAGLSPDDLMAVSGTLLLLGVKII